MAAKVGVIDVLNAGDQGHEEGKNKPPFSEFDSLPPDDPFAHHETQRHMPVIEDGEVMKPVRESVPRKGEG